MRTIGAVTTSRADYSSLLPVLQAIDADPELHLLLFVSGMHLSPEFGLTVNQIEADGFAIADRIDMHIGLDTTQEVVKSMGRGVIGFSDSLTKFRPDIMLIVGDRFELLSVVCAALPLCIPIAHISGGDITEGAIDNQVRHAITKMSHIHFPDMEAHGDRLIQMGEEAWRVVVSGDPALDLLHQLQFLDRDELSRDLGLKLEAPLILVSLHPTTLGTASVREEIDNLLEALSRVKSTLVFTYPNADAHHQVIVERVKDFVENKPNCGLFFNLGQTRYYNLLATADLMVGNSSSGIFEAPSFRLPVVNLGERQRGRIRERNVIDVNGDSNAIHEAIQRGLEPNFRASLADLQNPYGDGEATPRIVDTLKNIRLGPELLQKRFADIYTRVATPVSEAGSC